MAKDMPAWLKARIAAKAGQATPATTTDYFSQPSSWTPVESSNVHSISFKLGPNGRHGELRVRFKDKQTGRVKAEYQYVDVPEDVFAAFLGAPSKGEFVWSDIMDQYTAHKIR
jgi:KTSC domain